MFFATALVAAVAATSAFASPVKRAGALSINVNAPSGNVTSVDELKLSAEITNTGSEDLKIFKYGTIVDGSLPTKSFVVTKDDKVVQFQGMRLSFSFDDSTDQDYFFINAGETKTVEHDLSALYDFESAGAGAFSFAPVTNFQVAPVSAEVKSQVDLSSIEVTANNVDIFVSDDVAKRDPEAGVEKRGVLSCSNTSQANFISASYTEAKALASGAASYISSNGANSLYTAYYSTNSQTTVRGVFTGVANESGSRTFSCSDPYSVCGSGTIAYTLIATTNIYYCSIFYNEVASTNLCSGTTVASRNVRGGTTLHEITHAVSGTDDVTYGCSADQSLSTSNKLINADNYNCFATQVYQNTQC